MTVTADVRASREALVRRHFESETAQEFDATLATFDHPHYEVIATQSVYDGRDEVKAYYTMTRTAFPDRQGVPLPGDRHLLLRRRRDLERADLLRHDDDHEPARGDGLAHRERMTQRRTSA